MAKKKKGKILLIIILIALLFFYSEKKTTDDDEEPEYKYKCEGRDVWLETIVPGEPWSYEFFLDCDDYFPGEGRECKGARLRYSYPRTPQFIATKKCFVHDPPTPDADILYVADYIEECSTGSYDYCYHIYSLGDTNPEATYKWGYSDYEDNYVYPEITLDWNCDGTDGLAPSGFVWRLDRSSQRMTCESRADGTYDCRHHGPGPTQERTEIITATHSGTITINWDTLREWGLDSFDSFYLFSGCYGQYYAYGDQVWTYVFIQDRALIGTDLLENCDDEHPCGKKLVWEWKGEYDTQYQEQADDTELIEDTENLGYCSNVNNFWDGVWNTFGRAECDSAACNSRADCYWIETYIKPDLYEYGLLTQEADSATVKIKIEGVESEIDIPDICWDTYPDMIKIRAHSGASGSGSCGSGYHCNTNSHLYCKTPGGWHELLSSLDNALYEAGIEWRIKVYVETEEDDPVTDGMTCLSNKCTFDECITDGDCDDGYSCVLGMCNEIQQCASDLQECWDGSYVGRDPHNDCEFRPCPPQTTLDDVIDAIADWITGDISRTELGDIIMEWANAE